MYIVAWLQYKWLKPINIKFLLLILVKTQRNLFYIYVSGLGKIPFNIGICCTRGEILKQFLHVHINLIYFKLNQRRSFALCNPIYCQKLIMSCLCHIKLGFILKKKVESVMPCVWQGRIYVPGNGPRKRSVWVIYRYVVC